MTLMQQILPTKSIAMVEDKRYRWMTRYAKDETKLNVINLASPYEYGREIIRNDEMKIMWTEFENITVPVSEQYDHLLTRQYKDWRQLPTESQWKSIHISNFNEEVK